MDFWVKPVFLPMLSYSNEGERPVHPGASGTAFTFVQAIPESTVLPKSECPLLVWNRHYAFISSRHPFANSSRVIQNLLRRLDTSFQTRRSCIMHLNGSYGVTLTSILNFPLLGSQTHHVS